MTAARIELRGLTTLKNRRVVPDKPNSYIYDALFSCAEANDESEDGVGSFRHYVGRDSSRKQDGTYEIEAKILGFHPKRNVNSDAYSDNQINILGEIITVRL